MRVFFIQIGLQHTVYFRYYVDYLAAGTGSLILNGNYYFHRHGTNFLVRYNLETAEQHQSDALGELAHADCA